MYISTAYARRLMRPRALAGAALVGSAAALAAGSAVATAHPARIAPAKKASGDVDVFSAGSLDTLITKDVAPAFHRATGYTLVDTSHGSSALAAEIKDKVAVADVFLSASPKVTQTLMGRRNGNWVSWYAEFADSPYVLGYNPQSKFARQLRREPWYKVITQSGFQLGRTNPSQDPGGVLAVKALDAAAAKYHSYSKALRKLASESSDEYDEDIEEAGIQNGQLDGAFLYESDAISQSSPFVRLSGVPTLYGDYTISLVKDAPHTAAADAFIRFMLSSEGQRLLRAQKFGVISPAKVTGSVPRSLKGVVK